MKTKVIFYKEPNESMQQGFNAMAVFPDESPLLCYTHIGQHSECSIEYVNDLKKATPNEYKELQRELESIDYDLDILN